MFTKIKSVSIVQRDIDPRSPAFSAAKAVGFRSIGLINMDFALPPSGWPEGVSVWEN
jgi:hypothetical protein